MTATNQTTGDRDDIRRRHIRDGRALPEIAFSQHLRSPSHGDRVLSTLPCHRVPTDVLGGPVDIAEKIALQKEITMNDDLDLKMFEDALNEFRRDEASVSPAAHSPHGDAQAWRLDEALTVGSVGGV